MLLLLLACSLTAADVIVQTSHTTSIEQVTFAPDDRFVYTAADDGTVRQWDTPTGLLVRAFTVHTPKLARPFFFSTDGSLLALHDETGILLWDNVDAKLLGKVQRYYGANVVARSKKLILVANTFEAHLYDAETLKMVRQLKVDEPAAAVFDATGRRLAIRNKKGITTIDTTTWDDHTFDDTPMVCKPYYSPTTGAHECSTARFYFPADGGLVVWEEPKKPATSCHGSYRPCEVTSFDGKYVAKVKYKNVAISLANTEAPTAANSASWIESVVWADHDRLLGVAGDGTAHFWDLRLLRPVTALTHDADTSSAEPRRSLSDARSRDQTPRLCSSQREQSRQSRPAWQL